MLVRTFVSATLALGLAAGASAQRVQPYPVMPPPQFERALAEGTRSATGAPGAGYWQNTADYDLDARLDADAQTLAASGTVTYTNNSPDALDFLVLKLRQNVHAPGVPRNRPVAVTGGLTLERFAVGGMDYRDVTVPETPGSYSGTVEPGTYSVLGTVMTVGLADPLGPGETATLELAWSYPVPPSTGTYRQGTDGEVFYVGYWYPQMAVYDDVYGWNVDPYLGMGEHYTDYGTYRVSFDAPADMLVYATGEHTNPEAVFTDRTRARLAEAMTSDETVHVVTADERGTALAPAASGRRVWEFVARDVRDVAVSASAAYVWDATHAAVGPGRRRHGGVGAHQRVLPARRRVAVPSALGALGRVLPVLHRAPLRDALALPVAPHDGRRGHHHRGHGVPHDDAHRRRPHGPVAV